MTQGSFTHGVAVAVVIKVKVEVAVMVIFVVRLWFISFDFISMKKV